MRGARMKRWTMVELQRVKGMLGHHSVPEIARRLERTTKSVREAIAGQGWTIPRAHDESLRARGIALIDGGMSYKQAARELGVSMSTIHRWKNPGAIPCKRIPRPASSAPMLVTVLNRPHVFPEHPSASGRKFCRSCRNWLSRQHWSVATARATGRCDTCMRLDWQQRNKRARSKPAPMAVGGLKGWGF